MDLKISPGPLHGEIKAIPSKSHAHRILIASKISQLQTGKPAHLNIPAFSDDIKATCRCLEQFDMVGIALRGNSGRGSALSPDAEKIDSVAPSGDESKPPLQLDCGESDQQLQLDCGEIDHPLQLDCGEIDQPLQLDCGESGSTLRFLLPLAAVLDRPSIFLGSGRLPQRPLSPLWEELQRHGCTLTDVGGASIPAAGTDHVKDSSAVSGASGAKTGAIVGLDDTADAQEICTITGPLQPGDYSLPGNVSSQFITGLLFALPLLNGNSSLRLTTTLESSSYVDMTLDVLSQFGITVERTVNDYGFFEFEIPGHQVYHEPASIEIEGDWSNSAFWLICKSLGHNISISGLDRNSCQGDKIISEKLAAMGIPPAGINFSASQFPDLVPPLALAMSVARGTSMITNADRLRLKESDRLSAICDVLSSLGANVSITGTGSGLCFTSVPQLKGGKVDSRGDHRIAMMAAIAATICSEPVILTGAEAVNKSYPDFFRDLVSLGGKMEIIG